jgi:hypothetical protein
MSEIPDKWRDASKAARKLEHHWPADCLAEAADVYDNLLAERDRARSIAAALEAQLARVEALADEWDAALNMEEVYKHHAADRLRAVLEADDA